jgi:hypothetical protein
MFFSLNYVKEKVSISRDTVCTLETGLGPERVFERLLLVLTAFGAFLELLPPNFVIVSHHRWLLSVIGTFHFC